MKDDSLYIVAIVAVVAVVGLVIMATGSTTVVAQDSLPDMVESDSSAIAGQAAYGVLMSNYGDITDGAACPDYTEIDCGELEDHYGIEVAPDLHLAGDTCTPCIVKFCGMTPGGTTFDTAAEAQAFIDAGVGLDQFYPSGSEWDAYADELALCEEYFGYDDDCDDETSSSDTSSSEETSSRWEVERTPGYFAESLKDSEVIAMIDCEDGYVLVDGECVVDTGGSGPGRVPGIITKIADPECANPDEEYPNCSEFTDEMSDMEVASR